MYFFSPYLGQIAKFISQMQDFERVLDLTQFGPGEIFLLMAQGGGRFDTTHSHVNNSRITKHKKSVFASQKAQFSDIKSKLFVIIFATLIFD